MVFISSSSPHPRCRCARGCVMMFFFHQYLISSRISIVWSSSAFRSEVIVRLAWLKTRSSSADIAGIDSRSRACCVILGHRFCGLRSHGRQSWGVAKTVGGPLIYLSNSSPSSCGFCACRANNSTMLATRCGGCCRGCSIASGNRGL